MTTTYLPPIIRDWIENATDKKTPVHIRENYIMMLDHVAQKCRETVNQHRSGTRSFDLTKSKSKSKI